VAVPVLPRTGAERDEGPASEALVRRRTRAGGFSTLRAARVRAAVAARV